MLIKLFHTVQLSGRNHKWVMAAAGRGCDIQSCGYVLQVLLSNLLWSAAFSPLCLAAMVISYLDIPEIDRLAGLSPSLIMRTVLWLSALEFVHMFVKTAT